MSFLKQLVHNCIVHPLLMVLPESLGTKLHDRNGDWAFGKPNLSNLNHLFVIGEGKTLISKGYNKETHTFTIILSNPAPKVLEKGMGSYIYGRESRNHLDSQLSMGKCTILSFKDPALRDSVYDSFFSSVDNIKKGDSRAQESR